MSCLQANTTSLQTLSRPPLHSNSKIIKNPKPLRPKLERILEPHMTVIIGDETEFSEGFKNGNNNLRYIFGKYESYYNTVHDGNEVFRIIGIAHMQNIMNNIETVERFCADLLESKVQASVLTDVPSEHMKHCNKDKIVKIYKAVVMGLQKKKATGRFYKNMAELLNEYKIFDFGIVAFYRLYTYIFGFLNIDNVNELRIEEKSILCYEAQTNSDIINTICQCFSFRVDVYDISNSNVDLTRYGANTLNSKIYTYFAFFKFGNHYALAEQKTENQIKQEQQMLAQLGRDDLTISEILQKKNSSSQQNLTDRKLLWQNQIDIPISPIPQQTNRPRRYTQKLSQPEDRSCSSFINQKAKRLESQKEKFSQLVIRKTETLIQQPLSVSKKSIRNLNIFAVLNQKVQPQHKYNIPIPQQQNQIHSSRKGSNQYPPQSSRISNKTGRIKKQNISSHSFQSTHSFLQRRLQLIYSQLNQSQRKQIVMHFIRSRQQQLNTDQKDIMHRCTSRQLASPKSLIIQMNDMSISITPN